MVRIPRTLTFKKENLEKRLAKLSEDYAAVSDQIDRESDSDKRNQLQRKVDDFLEQMGKIEIELKEAENELNQLEAPEKKNHQSHLDIQENLREIDFQEAIKMIEIIENDYFKIEGGEAFFLLEDSHSMAGEYLISKIRDNFTRKTRHFRHLIIEIQPATCIDEFGLISLFAGYLNVKVESIVNKREYVNRVINKVCKSLQSGSIVFIEIKKWSDLQEQERILEWFIKDFWSYLIDECRSTIQQKDLLDVRLLALIDADIVLNDECSNLPCYCTLDDFDSKKILKIPLKDWEQEDIQKWLARYGGLSASRTQISQMAEKIYLKSRRGIPRMVCEVLQEDLQKELNRICEF